MMIGLVPLAVAAIGASYATLVLRGWRRRDNLVFGVLALTDAAMIAWRGINELTGSSITSPAVMIPCAFGGIVLSMLTLEFIVGLWLGRAMVWRWRGPMLAWGAAGTVVTFATWDGEAPHLVAELVFFLPATLLVIALGARAFARNRQRDVRVVIAALWFRWVFATLAYTIGPPLGMFATATWIDTTVVALASFVVIGTAVLRGDMFSIRSAALEAVTIAGLALVVMLGGGAAVTAALFYVEPGRLQHVALLGAATVPLALAVAGQALYPRVERRVIAGLDERRARRLGVQGEPLPAAAPAAIDEATRRIAAMSDGAIVRWVAAADLPAALTDAIARGEPLRRDERADLPAGFVVPALGADRAVVGAFYVDGGLVDRDTYEVARDLAARVAVAVERADAVSELHDARRLAALGQFAAAIAHDIRTPLTSISLNVQILRRKLQLSDDDLEHMDIALEELARLDRSVAEILEFAKPVKLTAERIDIAELIETTTRNLAPVLRERGVTVRVEPGRASPLTVHGDPQRLRQVLTNLVDNAANASHPGTNVTLRATADDDCRIAIEVEDHGRGIGPEDLPRIFEPFFTTRPDGTGLGLAIVQKVVRAHGGDIKVRSTVGGGSTFTITLPAPG